MTARILLVLLLALALASTGDITPADHGSRAGGGTAFRYVLFDNARVSESFSGNFLLIGGRGYTALTPWLRYGGGGFGDLAVINGPEDKDAYFLGLGYGGMILEPYFVLGEGLIVSLPVLIGGGSYEFERVIEDLGDNRYHVEHYKDSFFALEPSVELMWKPIPFLGICLNGGYLFAFNDGDVFKGSAYVGLALYFGMP